MLFPWGFTVGGWSSPSRALYNPSPPSPFPARSYLLRWFAFSRCPCILSLYFSLLLLPASLPSQSPAFIPFVIPAHRLLPVSSALGRVSFHCRLLERPLGVSVVKPRGEGWEAILSKGRVLLFVSPASRHLGRPHVRLRQPFCLRERGLATAFKNV